MALVKYNGKNVYSCCGVRLLPGVNEVEDGLLETALSVPLFQWRIDNGAIELVKEKKGKDKKTSVKQLTELMSDVYDVKVLKRHIKENKDKKLVEAAKKQLDRIAKEPADEVEDGVTVK